MSAIFFARVQPLNCLFANDGCLHIIDALEVYERRDLVSTRKSALTAPVFGDGAEDVVRHAYVKYRSASTHVRDDIDVERLAHMY